MFDKLIACGVPDAAQSIKNKLEISLEACTADKGTLTKMYRFKKAADNSKLTVPAIQEALSTCGVDCETLN